tara:strand:+ start:29 stop:694 length:666 start_codon:yes stop_codon:yes gene_type:complete
MFITYQQTSEQSYLIDYGNDIDINTNKKVISHFNYILKNNFYFIKNIVPSFNKILIQFDPKNQSRVLNLITKLKLIDTINEFKTRKHIINICYDEEYALDYKKVEKAFSLTFEEFIKFHSSHNYFVFMIGFMPGLPFLGLTNSKKKIPRLENPRLIVPKGSLGVVDNLSVIYPNQSPGGWNIIGKTNYKLFNNYKYISILKPGDTVRFNQVNKKIFNKNEN